MFGQDADGHFIPVCGFMQLKLFFSQVTFAKPKSSQNSSIGKSYSLQKKFHTRAPYMLSQPSVVRITYVQNSEIVVSC